MDYRQMLAEHEAKKADLTVAVVRVPIESAHRFGTLKMDAGGRIGEFVEKSSQPASNLASMGIYVFNRNLLVERLYEDASNPNSPHDFGYAILPKMVKQDRVFAFQFNDYWRDIGTVEAYYEANMELLGASPRFRPNAGRSSFTEDNSSISRIRGQKGRITNSLISPGCVIKGLVENSILSPGVYVDENAEVRNSIVMANTSIGYHSLVDRCVLDEGVKLGQYCYVGFGKSPLPGSCEITVLGKDVTVPSHTAIGRECKVLPHIGSAAFNSRVIPSGSTIA
jgi:glucose-1-phosphate adenylyltransferase